MARQSEDGSGIARLRASRAERYGAGFKHVTYAVEVTWLAVPLVYSQAHANGVASGVGVDDRKTNFASVEFAKHPPDKTTASRSQAATAAEAPIAGMTWVADFRTIRFVNGGSDAGQSQWVAASAVDVRSSPLHEKTKSTPAAKPESTRNTVLINFILLLAR
jgi:hypothetical protein